MSVSTVGPNIAYLCDGMGCAAVRENGEPCVIFEDKQCRHTFDPAHAVNGTCENPSKCGDRFEAWNSGELVTYWEKEDWKNSGKDSEKQI